MPRSNTQTTSSKSSKYTYNASDVMSRTSYTGPIMPRPIEQPTFTQNVKQGFSFGIGANIAGRFMENLFGPKVSPVTQEATVLNTPTVLPQSTGNNSKDFVGKAPFDVQIAYQQCLKDNGDHETCKEYLI